MLASVSTTYSDILTSVFSTPIAGKAWFATAARIFGKLAWLLPARFAGVPVSRVHRWSGRIAFVCTLPVAFHCIFILGFKTTDARVLVHSLFGSFLYGAFAVKVF